MTLQWLQESLKRRAGATRLLQTMAGNRTARACSAIQTSGQHVSTGNLSPSLHFWGSSSTSEEQVVYYCRRTEKLSDIKAWRWVCTRPDAGICYGHV